MDTRAQALSARPLPQPSAIEVQSVRANKVLSKIIDWISSVRTLADPYSRERKPTHEHTKQSLDLLMEITGNPSLEGLDPGLMHCYSETLKGNATLAEMDIFTTSLGEANITRFLACIPPSGMTDASNQELRNQIARFCVQIGSGALGTLFVKLVAFMVCMAASQTDEELPKYQTSSSDGSSPPPPPPKAPMPSARAAHEPAVPAALGSFVTTLGSANVNQNAAPPSMQASNYRNQRRHNRQDGGSGQTSASNRSFSAAHSPMAAGSASLSPYYSRSPGQSGYQTPARALPMSLRNENEATPSPSRIIPSNPVQVTLDATMAHIRLAAKKDTWVTELEEFAQGDPVGAGFAPEDHVCQLVHIPVSVSPLTMAVACTICLDAPSRYLRSPVGIMHWGVPTMETLYNRRAARMALGLSVEEQSPSEEDAGDSEGLDVPTPLTIDAVAEMISGASGRLFHGFIGTLNQERTGN